MNPETTRKAPRTAAAAYNGHDYLLKECRTLEIETQELTLAIKALLEPQPAPFARDFASDVLARHRANQEVAP